MSAAVYVTNTTSLQLVEVSFATEGRHRNPTQRALPIACFQIVDGVAHPVTTVPRAPEAHYFLHDPGRKVWWDKDGREWGNWADLMRPIYAADARENPSEPTPEPKGLTVPSIGSVGDHWGIGQEPSSPRPWKATPERHR